MRGLEECRGSGRHLTNSPAAQVSRRLPRSLKLNNTDTMSDAEVKNDVAAEAPSAEELKAQKRSAEVYFHCYSHPNTYMQSC